MKKTLILIVSTTIIIGLAIFFVRSNRHIDSSFATSASLKYVYIEKNIDTTITDPDDIAALKEILNGYSYRDHPSCGFSNKISITLSDGQTSITFCPACDSCSTIRINDSDYYISITAEQRAQFNEIAEKYGMTFPCV